VDECGVCGGLGDSCALSLGLAVDLVSDGAGTAQDLGVQVGARPRRIMAMI